MRVPSPFLASDRDRDYGVMTPMIDVVFQLLIFFVVASAGHVAEALLPAELPATGAVAAPVDPLERESWADDVWVRLSVDPASQRTLADLNGTTYRELGQLKAVLAALAQISTENHVILDIAQETPMRDVVFVLDTCRAAGFESVDFAADAAAAAPLPPGTPAR
jgi:biopolymer transport protein ExbD